MAKKKETPIEEKPTQDADDFQENIPLNLRSSMADAIPVSKEPVFVEVLNSAFLAEIPYEVLEPISDFNTRCEQSDLTKHAGRHCANICKNAISYIDEHIIGGFQKSLTGLRDKDASLKDQLINQVSRSVNNVVNELTRELESYEQNITRHDTPKFYRGFDNPGFEFLVECLIDCGLISVPKKLSIEKQRKLHRLPASIKSKLNLNAQKLPSYLTEDEQTTLVAYEEGMQLLLNLIDWISGIKEIPIETQLIEETK